MVRGYKNRLRLRITGVDYSRISSYYRYPADTTGRLTDKSPKNYFLRNINLVIYTITAMFKSTLLIWLLNVVDHCRGWLFSYTIGDYNYWGEAGKSSLSKIGICPRDLGYNTCVHHSPHKYLFFLKFHWYVQQKGNPLIYIILITMYCPGINSPVWI